MAGFRQHLAGGIAVGAFGGMASFHSLHLSLSQSSVAFILGCLGGVLPDIDSDSSKPVQMLFGYLGVILPVVMLTQLFPNGAVMENVLLTAVGGYFVVRYLISALFLKFTTHRGIIHSVPAVVICGLLTYLLFRKSDSSARLVFAIVCAIGYLVHLILDEVWSVNLMGLRMKKSFGSALTMSSKSTFITIMAYTTILILVVIIFFERRPVDLPESTQVQTESYNTDAVEFAKEQ